MQPQAQQDNRCSSRLLAWIDARFPLTQVWNEHLAKYYAPKNLNFWYFFGSFAFIVLINQIVTGIWLTMNYKPAAQLAFDSVEAIMRDFNWGWLIRYMHSTGASMFFIVVYLHIFRGMMYGSYKKPRELVWILGVSLFIALMAEAFMGYLLPWGQMSYWGANVIVSLFGAIPVIGEDIATWLRGDFLISDVTLNRFFSFHVIAVPLVIVLLVFLHIVALHKVGSNNPDGIEIKENKDTNGVPLDGIPFHPYYTVKDLFGATVFLAVCAWIVFYAPEFGGYFLEKPNFIPADPLKTPEHIAPVWYFTPFYSILRAIPNKFGGMVLMFMAIFLLFFLPWLDRCPVRSIRYRGNIYKIALALLVISFIGLGYLGTQAPTPTSAFFSALFTTVYFGFFLLMPIYTRLEITKPLPQRLTVPKPLLEREGWFYENLRKTLRCLQRTAWYRKAEGQWLQIRTFMENNKYLRHFL